MEWIDGIEHEIDKLKDNISGIKVQKNISRGVISADIIIPRDTFSKDLTGEDIEFQLVIDTFSLKLHPRLYCLTPYCFPHLADGRDLYKELRNSTDSISLENLLGDIIEFIKINFERGGLIFCGNYYLGAKYDLRIFKNGCENIINVKENLVLNGKTIKFNRLLIFSDVYFLLLQQEKWYKNNLTLLFWSSINNIEKIQKVKDNKTVILHWTTKNKENAYLMSLTFINRDSFIDKLMETMKTFGMNFDIMKINKNNEIEHKTFSSPAKLKHKESDDKEESQNKKLVNFDDKKNDKEEGNDEEEEEEEEDDNKKEVKKENDKSEKNEKNDEKSKNIENNKDGNKINNIEDEKESKNKEDSNKENIKKDDEEDLDVDINIGKK